MTINTLLIATRNKNKLSEVKNALIDLNIRVIDLTAISIDHVVEETGETYKENAIKKAKEYGNLSQIPTIADDSGLEVNTLEGKPGIKSARFVSGTDEDRNKEILRLMRKVPSGKRAAIYKCIIALFDPGNNRTWVFSGYCNGKITLRPRGKNGFGYDPVFYYPKRKKTFAQMTIGEKEKVSHRGIALRKVAKFLEREMKKRRDIR